MHPNFAVTQTLLYIKSDFSEAVHNSAEPKIHAIESYSGERSQKI